MIVQLLLDSGADPAAKNKDGKTALDLVKSEEIGALFSMSKGKTPLSEKSTEERPTEDKRFVPGYLMHPELIPAITPPSVADLSGKLHLHHCGTGRGPSRVLMFLDKRENRGLLARLNRKVSFLVYLESHDRPLGSVLVDPVAKTVKDLKAIISEASISP